MSDMLCQVLQMIEHLESEKKQHADLLGVVEAGLVWFMHMFIR
jgi:hypothetical protein